MAENIRLDEQCELVKRWHSFVREESDRQLVETSLKLLREAATGLTELR